MEDKYSGMTDMEKWKQPDFYKDCPEEYQALRHKLITESNEGMKRISERLAVLKTETNDQTNT